MCVRRIFLKDMFKLIFKTCKGVLTGSSKLTLTHCCPLDTLKIFTFIGASLSEPHTSVTALQDVCMCMSGTYIREAI